MKGLKLGGCNINGGDIEGFEQISKISKISPGKQGVDLLMEHIDELDEEEALRLIELPQETIYLIDKVVRQRAKAGPIGVDNSELINIEIEQEYKHKN